MARSTLTAQVADLTAQVAALASLVTGLVVPVSSTIAPVAATPVLAPEHIGPSGKPDGRRFPCPVCGALFRSTGLAPNAKGGVAWHVREVHAA